MSDKNIYQILESLDAAQRGVKQLPALFKPKDTSPQLSGPYPGRNATLGYLVGEGDETGWGSETGDSGADETPDGVSPDTQSFLDEIGVDPNRHPQTRDYGRGEEENAMRQAVTRRIVNQHPEWITRYGVEFLMQVIDDVTEGETDWEEIGSSDVSAFVNMVGDQLRDRGGSREEMADRRPFAESIRIVDQDYDLDQIILTLDINGKQASFTYTDYDEDFANAERKEVFAQLQEKNWYKNLDHPTKMEILDAAYRAIRGEEPGEYRPTVDDEPMDVVDRLGEQGVAEDGQRYKFQRIKFRGTDHDIGEERYRFVINGDVIFFNFPSDEDRPDPDSPSFEEILAKVQRSGEVRHYRITPAEQQAIAKKIAAERQRYLDQRRQDMAEGHADQQKTIVKRNGQPVGEIGIDRESSPGAGMYYMKHYATGLDLGGYDSREEALDELRYAIKQGVAESKNTTEDVISTVKKKLGDYLSDLSKEIKQDPDLKDKLERDIDQIGPAVKTLKTDDGHEIKIHGNEDDGFRITIKNREAKTRFRDLDEATMAVEMYCARRRGAVMEKDYLEER